MCETGSLLVCVCVCVFKTERENVAEENARMYAELKEARETVEELKQEKGIFFYFAKSYMFADTVV